MRKVYLTTRTKNALHAYNKNYDVRLHNIEINGVKHGCSGFVFNPNTNLIIWLTTEDNHFIVRYAKNSADYVGGINRWSESFEEMIMLANHLLVEKQADINEQPLLGKRSL